MARRLLGLTGLALIAALGCGVRDKKPIIPIGRSYPSAYPDYVTGTSLDNMKVHFENACNEYDGQDANLRRYIFTTIPIARDHRLEEMGCEPGCEVWSCTFDKLTGSYTAQFKIIDDDCECEDNEGMSVK